MGGINKHFWPEYTPLPESKKFKNLMDVFSQVFFPLIVVFIPFEGMHETGILIFI